jgi:hypothetical protein
MAPGGNQDAWLLADCPVREAASGSSTGTVFRDFFMASLYISMYLHNPFAFGLTTS